MVATFAPCHGLVIFLSWLILSIQAMPSLLFHHSFPDCICKTHVNLFVMWPWRVNSEIEVNVLETSLSGILEGAEAWLNSRAVHLWSEESKRKILTPHLIFSLIVERKEPRLHKYDDMIRIDQIIFSKWSLSLSPSLPSLREEYTSLFIDQLILGLVMCLSLANEI